MLPDDGFEEGEGLGLQVARDIMVLGRIGIVLLTTLMCLGAVCASGEESSRKDTGKPLVQSLEARLYWYYEAMGKLENVQDDGRQVTGVYRERMKPTHFVVERARLLDVESRTEGYVMAIQKIVAYMAPGAVPDNEANRKYMAERLQKLQAITGERFSTSEQWETWLEESLPSLRWSEADDRLIVVR